MGNQETDSYDLSFSIDSRLTEKYKGIVGKDSFYTEFEAKQYPEVHDISIINNTYPNLYTVSDYGKVSTNKEVLTCIAVSNDGVFALLGFDNGSFQKQMINDNKLISFDKKYFKSGIISMAISMDDKNFFMASVFGEIKQVSLTEKHGTIIHNWGSVHNHRINCMRCTDEGRSIYVGSDFGHWFVIDIASKKIAFFDVIQDSHEIKCISVSRKNNLLLTSDARGVFMISKINQSCQKQHNHQNNFNSYTPISKKHYTNPNSLIGSIERRSPGRRSPDRRSPGRRSPDKRSPDRTFDLYSFSQEVDRISINDCLSLHHDKKLTLSNWTNQVHSVPVSFEVVKNYGKIHEDNNDKVYFIEQSPEEETFFTAGYRTQKQWNMKNLNQLKDFTEIQLFDIKSMKITKEGEMMFFGLRRDKYNIPEYEGNLVKWNVSNYSLLFIFTKENIKKRIEMIEKEKVQYDQLPPAKPECDLKTEFLLNASTWGSLKDLETIKNNQITKKGIFGCYKNLWLCYR